MQYEPICGIIHTCMRFFGAEREPQSPVTSLKVDEHSSGMLISGDWKKVQQVALGTYRALRQGTLDPLHGGFMFPSDEILAAAPDDIELQRLANLQSVIKENYSNDNHDSRGYGSIHLRRLDPSRYWLFFGFPMYEYFDTYSNYLAVSAQLAQSTADRFNLSYGIKRQVMEVQWGLATPEKYRIDRNKLQMAVQLATGAEFDRSSLRAFPERPLLGESSTLRMELKLGSIGSEGWFNKGAILEQPKQLAIDTGEVLYPRMRLTLQPSERVADVVHDTSRNQYDASTFDKDVIESMRAPIRELSDILKVGNSLA